MDTDNAIPPQTHGWVRISPGRFSMGSPASEEGRFDDEVRHEVVHTRAYRLSTVPEVQWRSELLMGFNPSRFKGPLRPADNVTFYEACAYANARSRERGLEESYLFHGPRGRLEEGTFKAAVEWRGLSCPGYRLLTEAEWERACRAGSTDARHGELDDVAWYWDNAGKQTHPVGEKRPNPARTFDMLGNVEEWVWDWYAPYPEGSVRDRTGPEAGQLRVARGGSWNGMSRLCRAAYRATADPVARRRFRGLRLARTG